jgi:hypothetical protein
MSHAPNTVLTASKTETFAVSVFSIDKSRCLKPVTKPTDAA